MQLPTEVDEELNLAQITKLAEQRLKRARQESLYHGNTVIEAEYDIDTNEVYLVEVKLYKKPMSRQ